MSYKRLLSDLKHSSRWPRLLAKFIDALIVLLLYQLIPIVAWLYFMLSDFTYKGQSLGKKFIGLKVYMADGGPFSLRASAVRNLPLHLPIFFSLIPLWGIPLAIIIGVPLVAMEIYLLFRLPSGKRLGDVMAETEVRSLYY